MRLSERRLKTDESKKSGQENRISEVISRISSIVSEVLSGCEDGVVLFSREAVFISWSFINSFAPFQTKNHDNTKICEYKS